MAAYLFVNIEVTDPERYARYVAAVPPTLAQFGARYLARGGTATQLEGTWEPKRVVILEFDSADRARAWWSSEDYRELRELRQASARTNMILVEGT